MSRAEQNTTITILGSGTCVPSLKRSSCSLLVETGNAKILFDSGAGTMRRLMETGVTIFDISHIFFSHFHPDHTGELASFLFSRKYPPADGRNIPLTIVAARGFIRFFNDLKSAFRNWIELDPGLMNIIELDNESPDTRVFTDFKINSIHQRKPGLSPHRF